MGAWVGACAWVGWSVGWLDIPFPGWLNFGLLAASCFCLLLFNVCTHYGDSRDNDEIINSPTKTTIPYTRTCICNNIHMRDEFNCLLACICLFVCLLVGWLVGWSNALVL